jgi:2-amino-4-hydroxy-6-hydroxymethyldihydropteridine diphosphokinase
MNTAYLLIGSNMGDRQKVLQKARRRIEDACGPVLQQSAIYQTAPWGLEAQNDFLNQVLRIETELDAHTLLREILAIEDGLGRQRSILYGPRIIDIDILFFNEDVIREKSLVVPHPQIQNRRFVLVPFSEIAPELVHPVLQKTIAQLLQECPDTLAVQKFQ